MSAISLLKLPNRILSYVKLAYYPRPAAFGLPMVILEVKVCLFYQICCIFAPSYRSFCARCQSVVPFILNLLYLFILYNLNCFYEKQITRTVYAVDVSALCSGSSAVCKPHPDAFEHDTRHGRVGLAATIQDCHFGTLRRDGCRGDEVCGSLQCRHGLHRHGGQCCH